MSLVFSILAFVLTLKFVAGVAVGAAVGAATFKRWFGAVRSKV